MKTMYFFQFFILILACCLPSISLADNGKLICGKDSMSSKFEFIENCFPAYTVKASQYFESEDSIVTVTPVLGPNDYKEFQLSLNIEGIISQGRHSHEIERVVYNDLFTFTGDIIKYCPDTVGYEFGSRENASRLVIYKNKLYRAILDEELDKNWYLSLPSKCKC